MAMVYNGLARSRLGATRLLALRLLGALRGLRALGALVVLLALASRFLPIAEGLLLGSVSSGLA